MKTYSQLLKNDDRSVKKRKAQVEFLKENKTPLFNNFYPQEYDYVVFVGCMEIFSENGVNYFEEYVSFRYDSALFDYSNGFEGYCKSIEQSRGGYPDDLNKAKSEYIKGVVNLIKMMSFFEITNCNGRSIDYYIKLLEYIGRVEI